MSSVGSILTGVEEMYRNTSFSLPYLHAFTNSADKCPPPLMSCPDASSTTDVLRLDEVLESIGVALESIGVFLTEREQAMCVTGAVEGQSEEQGDEKAMEKSDPHRIYLTVDEEEGTGTGVRMF